MDQIAAPPVGADQLVHLVHQAASMLLCNAAPLHHWQCPGGRNKVCNKIPSRGKHTHPRTHGGGLRLGVRGTYHTSLPCPPHGNRDSPPQLSLVGHLGVGGCMGAKWLGHTPGPLTPNLQYASPTLVAGDPPFGCKVEQACGTLQGPPAQGRHGHKTACQGALGVGSQQEGCQPANGWACCTSTPWAQAQGKCH